MDAILAVIIVLEPVGKQWEKPVANDSYDKMALFYLGI